MPSIDQPRLACAEIIIKRQQRQRKRIETGDLEASIRARGVLQPIIVTRDNVLVAGERRLTTSMKLGIPDIPVRFIDEVSALELAMIELEENVKRMDLPWQDKIAAIKEIHKLGKAGNPNWVTKNLVELTGYNIQTLTQMLRVAESLDNPIVAKCTSWGAAFNIITRDQERKFAAAVEMLEDSMTDAFAESALTSTVVDEVATSEEPDDSALDTLLETSAPVAATTAAPITTQTRPLDQPKQHKDVIINTDFILWANAYSGPKFNLLHVDFPYGINFNTGEQGGRNDWSGYDDSADVYWDLCAALCRNTDKLMGYSAHMIFWFSMNYYTETLEFFRQNAPSWVFNPHPLYWLKSDNVGILPDPRRGPRRIVETALLATRGDRPIVKAVSNGIAAPTDKTLHQSTKPEPVAKHFLSMLVDNTTKILDPTAGSGSALRAAAALRAETIVGLELNSEHAMHANAAFNRAEALRRANKSIGDHND